MQVVKATLEAYANNYVALGIRPNKSEAVALVMSVVQQENSQPSPSSDEVEKLASELIHRVDKLATQMR